ncbi:unnamed protein product [Closterium sp. Yama58-4]|nr:unnamed protein product [Closterium sp. Yama58-4]
MNDLLPPTNQALAGNQQLEDRGCYAGASSRACQDLKHIQALTVSGFKLCLKSVITCRTTENERSESADVPGMARNALVIVFRTDAALTWPEVDSPSV